MSNIAEATPIILTSEERTELERLARSTKTEYRARVRARIVLMAADGPATRAIAREVGCAIRIVSKWRMRYAWEAPRRLRRDRNRGAAPKYGPETARRILALLETKPPEGYAGVVTFVGFTCQ